MPRDILDLDIEVAVSLTSIIHLEDGIILNNEGIPMSSEEIQAASDDEAIAEARQLALGKAANQLADKISRSNLIEEYRPPEVTDGVVTFHLRLGVAEPKESEPERQEG